MRGIKEKKEQFLVHHSFQNILKFKHGLSQVVATVILILIVMVAGLTVWAAVGGFADKDKLDESKNCLDLIIKNEVKINEDYTCYNFSSHELEFSISVGNVEISELIVLVSTPGETKSYTLSKDQYSEDDLLNYSHGNFGITIPNKNAGKTFIATGILEIPDSVEIAPKINDKQCDIADSLKIILHCSQGGLKIFTNEKYRF